MKKLSMETLQGMNKKQLYDYCRNNGIKGYSNMNKAYITNLILQSYKSQKQPIRKKSKPKITMEQKREDIRMLEVMQIAAVPKEQEKLEREIQRRKQRLNPKRYFEFHGTTSTGRKSAKFWEVWQDGKIIFVRFGIIGPDGRVMEKSYNTIEQASKGMEKQIRSKISKGYNELRTTIERKQITKSISKPKIRREVKISAIPKSRIRPMLASENEKYLDAPGYIAQQKYDGTRCIIIKKNNKISLIGRSWKSNYAPNFPEIVNDIKKIQLNSFILDSELTFFKGGKDIFLTALATEQSKKGYIAKCMVFDILEYNNKDVKNIPLSERIKLLEIVPKGLKHLEVVKSYKTNHKKFFENIISDKMQGEGVVLKDLESKYMESGRTKDWIKVKGWKSDEAIVVGVTHGTGIRSDSFGSLILVQYHNKKLKFVGRASGFKQSEQDVLIEKMKNIKTKEPQIGGIPSSKIKYWVKPKLVVEIKFQERTKDGKFRFPSFLRIRNDKTPKECTI
ncbi:hypothetical protein LCGC14_0603220 [marine sediment metagenome]|uniref:ATP-dependent DNA ligase family profile domain-containing protein n=1 Tax=marine sediment metagenome TaxID=412755 RepID=A0A0F9RU07_9ZZZZ